MAFRTSDQFLVNRDGVDYKTTYAALVTDLNTTLDQPGAGELVFKDSNGNEVGRFNADQATGSTTTVTFPKGFSGDYSDLLGAPTVGEGVLTIADANGTVGTFSANATGNATITLPAIVIPDSLHPMGFINVKLVAPTGRVGDVYIQSSLNDSEIADNSFAGLAGDTILNGTLVLFGSDNNWHAGGTVGDPVVGDGLLTVKNSDGSTAGTFSANAEAPTTITLPAGFSGAYSDLSGVPSEFKPEAHRHDYSEIDNTPTIGDGLLTIKQNGVAVATFNANATAPVVVELSDTNTSVDAYTKAESDAKFLAKNIATLPTLS